MAVPTHTKISKSLYDTCAKSSLCNTTIHIQDLVSALLFSSVFVLFFFHRQPSASAQTCNWSAGNPSAPIQVSFPFFSLFLSTNLRPSHQVNFLFYLHSSMSHPHPPTICIHHHLCLHANTPTCQCPPFTSTTICVCHHLHLPPFASRANTSTLQQICTPTHPHTNTATHQHSCTPTQSHQHSHRPTHPHANGHHP